MSSDNFAITSGSCLACNDTLKDETASSPSRHARKVESNPLRMRLRCSVWKSSMVDICCNYPPRGRAETSRAVEHDHIALSVHAPGSVRHSLEERYRDSVERSLLDDLTLLASEVVTNAVQHSGCPQGDPLDVQAPCSTGSSAWRSQTEAPVWTCSRRARSIRPRVTAGRAKSTARSTSGSKSTSYPAACSTAKRLRSRATQHDRRRLVQPDRSRGGRKLR